jgi:hypothetical protein
MCGGVCTNTASDPNNCGTCGNACTSGQACVSGACTSSSSCNSATDCPSGQACDLNVHACTTSCGSSNLSACNGGCCNNGACAPGNTNSACGASGGACFSCPIGCATGLTLCSGNDVCQNGGCVDSRVCVNEQTDPNNCGACGQACTSGQTCVSGVCTATCTGGSKPLCGGACQTIHSNGLGQNYFDCNPLGTYNATTATEAATAFSPTATITQVTCSGSNGVVLAQTATSCAAWDFSGNVVGHVNLSSSSACFCPTSGDPGWN